MGANYSFYVKSIATYVPTFFGYNHSVIAIVGQLCIGIGWMYTVQKAVVGSWRNLNGIGFRPSLKLVFEHTPSVTQWLMYSADQ